MKKIDKTYHFGLNRSDMSTIICTSKAELARFVGISEDTLSRYTKISSVYIDERMVIALHTPLTHIYRGFARKYHK